MAQLDLTTFTAKMVELKDANVANGPQAAATLTKGREAEAALKAALMAAGQAWPPR